MSGVLVVASRAALEQARRCGIDRLEQTVERAICAGRKRRSIPGGETLAPNLRHVLVTRDVGAIVAKDGRTGGGRARYRALRLVPLRDSRSKEGTTR